MLPHKARRLLEDFKNICWLDKAKTRINNISSQFRHTALFRALLPSIYHEITYEFHIKLQQLSIDIFIVPPCEEHLATQVTVQHNEVYVRGEFKVAYR